MRIKKNIKTLTIIILMVIVSITIIAIILLSQNVNINNTIQAEQKSSQNINVNTETETRITASTIVKAKNKSEYYGKIIKGYICANGEGVNAWKIFYADENNIYLIADDYISYNYCPSSKVQTVNKGYSDYRLAMSDIIKDYDGLDDIIDEKIKVLNRDYFNEYDYTSNSDSMKAVAYMLDTNVWSVYVGEKAEYAIGGPTVEMLLKSYSQKYGVDYQAKANKLGYRISNDGGLTWSSDISNMLEVNDNLYVINSQIKATRMWLASPSCYSNYYVMCVNFNGGIVFDSYGSTFQGFRPVVCLKSNVYLEKQKDDTYIIR